MNRDRAPLLCTHGDGREWPPLLAAWADQSEVSQRADGPDGTFARAAPGGWSSRSACWSARSASVNQSLTISAAASGVVTVVVLSKPSETSLDTRIVARRGDDEPRSTQARMVSSAARKLVTGRASCASVIRSLQASTGRGSNDQAPASPVQRVAQEFGKRGGGFEVKLLAQEGTVMLVGP